MNVKEASALKEIINNSREKWLPKKKNNDNYSAYLSVTKIKKST